MQTQEIKRAQPTPATDVTDAILTETKSEKAAWQSEARWQKEYAQKRQIIAKQYALIFERLALEPEIREWLESKMAELRMVSLDTVMAGLACGEVSPAAWEIVSGAASAFVALDDRYALDAAKVSALSRSLPDDIGGEIVGPSVQGVIYKIFARYTVRVTANGERLVALFHGTVYRKETLWEGPAR